MAYIEIRFYSITETNIMGAEEIAFTYPILANCRAIPVGESTQACLEQTASYTL